MNRSPHCLKRFLHHLPHRSPFASSLYNSSVSILSLLKRLLLRAFRSFSAMDPFSLSLSLSPASPSSSALDDDFFASERTPPPDPETLVLVPFRWWYEANVALDGESEIGGVLFDVKSRLDKKEFFDSDIVLDLKSLGETRSDESEEKARILRTGGNDKCLALIAEWMFTRAFKWHNDKKDAEGYLAPSDSIDLLSLQIRVSFVHETSSLYIRINQRDNDQGAFDRACKIFHSESGLLRLWDIHGQTTQFLENEGKVSSLSDHLTDEILLKLQVYGTSFLEVREMDRDNSTMERCEASSSSGPRKMNGFAHGVESLSKVEQPVVLDDMHSTAYALGFTGLYNLGNTCFMNSALQCLVHTMELVDYFLTDFHKDLNFDNPLGMKGNLAVAFGDLLRKLWAPGALPLSPSRFKSAIAEFAPRFGGSNQHDAQEFLAFLLDGLHEDLNRVKLKPYIEVKDGEGRPDNEVADEHWRNHLARNNSIIVDLFQGQYRSKLVCHVCGKLSITFDPFMYLSLPLPSTTMRRMTLTVFSTDGITLPSLVTVSVPKCGTSKDLVQALNKACSLKDDETLVVAEIYDSLIIRFLDDPSDAIDLIRDEDQFVAYRLPKHEESYPIVVFMHQHKEKLPEKIGVPLVTRMSTPLKGCNIRNEYLKLLNPLLMPVEGPSYDDGGAVENLINGDTEVEKPILAEDADLSQQSHNDSTKNDELCFFLGGKHMPPNYDVPIDEPIPLLDAASPVEVTFCWPDKMIEVYDTKKLRKLPEVCKPSFFLKKPRESISLDRCLNAFLKEESLGPDDMWFCPACKIHQQANKKLDLWRLPEILIIHLKRFSYNRLFKNKLDTYVDFPVDDFDVSNYVIHQNESISHRYKLFAVSNHSGGISSGHYTAFVHHTKDKWFEFDDSTVFSVSEEQIKSPAAYVLFYRRIPDAAISNSEK